MADRVSDNDRAKMSNLQIASREVEPNMAEMYERHGDTLSLLDKLRATRKARGGSGAPLLVPAHLRDIASDDAKGVVITDEDLTITEKDYEPQPE